MARRKRPVRRVHDAARGAEGRQRPPIEAAPEDPTDRRGAVAAGAAIAAVTLALYLATAARDLVFGDAPELTGAAVTLGVAHPPGYPVWTVVAHLFTLVPVDTFSFRVSAFSAFAATGCVLLVYITAFRLSRSVLASAVAGLLLALTPVFWAWSIVPEVFALHAALAATLIALLQLWHERERAAYFVGAAFVGGLGLANQQTIALLGPAVLYLMWRRRRLLSVALLAKASLAFVGGLLPYAYLPLAAAARPAWNWGDISSPGELFAHVFRTAFGTGQLVSDRSFQGGAVVDRLVIFATSFDLVAAILVTLGAASLFRRDRTWFWFAAWSFVLTGPAFVAYANVDIRAPVIQSVLERFFILSGVVAAPLAALGLVWTVDTIRGALGGRRDRWVAVLVAAASLVAPVIVAAASLPRIDQRDNHNARHFAEDILATTPQGKILLAGGDAIIMPIGYLRTIEGARPDLTYLQIPLLTSDWYVRQVGRQYPDLVLRAPRYDGRAGTSRDLIEPNGPDRFAIAGGLLDDAMAATHDFSRRGLIQELRPKGQPVEANALASLNERLLAAYRVPTVAAVSGRQWDRLILADYAFIAYDVAQAYELQKAYAPARDWYVRALAIDPDLVEARAALARLPKNP